MKMILMRELMLYIHKYIMDHPVNCKSKVSNFIIMKEHIVWWWDAEGGVLQNTALILCNNLFKFICDHKFLYLLRVSFFKFELDQYWSGYRSIPVCIMPGGPNILIEIL